MTGEVCFLCKQRRTHGTHLYRFPKDPNLRKIWFEALNMPQNSTVYLLICDRHFDRSMISATGRRLTQSAIPCRMLGPYPDDHSFDTDINVSYDPMLLAEADFSNHSVELPVQVCDDDEPYTVDVSDDEDQLTPSPNVGNFTNNSYSDDQHQQQMQVDLEENYREMEARFSNENDDLLVPSNRSYSNSVSNDQSSRKRFVEPCRKFPLEEKVEIIREYERTKDIEHLPNKFSRRKKQIRRTLQHRVELVLEWYRFQQIGENREKRSPCRVKQAVGAILHEFLLRCRFYDIRITDELLLKKAKDIANMMNLNSFQAQQYWLKRFMYRFHLLEIDWNDWNVKNPSVLQQQSLDLKQITNELRSKLGEKIIPLPTKLDKKKYDRIMAELLQNDKPLITSSPDNLYNVQPFNGDLKVNRTFNGFSNRSVNTPINRSFNEYVNGMTNGTTNGTKTYPQMEDPHVISLVDDDDDDDDNEDGNGNGESGYQDCDSDDEDPMRIDSYHSAASYLYPLEQFISTQKSERAKSLVSQLSKAIANLVGKDGKTNATNRISIVNEVQIENYQDAVVYLAPLENFFMFKENLRVVGLIGQLEINFKDSC